jgi:hypothetical protein
MSTSNKPTSGHNRALDPAKCGVSTAQHLAGDLRSLALQHAFPWTYAVVERIPDLCLGASNLSRCRIATQ